MIQNYSHNVKGILGSLISNARAREGWGKGIYLFSFLKIIGSPAKRAWRADKKKRGSGGNEFLPARPVWGWESVSAIPASAGRQNRKIFVSLIEQNFRGARIKNCKENFSVLSAVRRAETLGGNQSAKSSGFCSKKVRISFSKHHQKTAKYFAVFLF